MKRKNPRLRRAYLKKFSSDTVNCGRYNTSFRRVEYGPNSFKHPIPPSKGIEKRDKNGELFFHIPWSGAQRQQGFDSYLLTVLFEHRGMKFVKCISGTRIRFAQVYSKTIILSCIYTSAETADKAFKTDKIHWTVVHEH